MFPFRSKSCLNVVILLILLTIGLYLFVDNFGMFPNREEFLLMPMARKKTNEMVEIGKATKINDPILRDFMNEMAQLNPEKTALHHERLNHLNCGLVLRNDLLHISRHRARFGRMRYRDRHRHRLAMDCGTIGQRNGFFKMGAAAQSNERNSNFYNAPSGTNFPVAFARNVFKDYRFLESELLANYSSQNWYCYALDQNAKTKFKRRMRQMAKCFPNVVVLARQFPMDSRGHNTSDALVECAKELAKPQNKWNYLITLQNHDVQIKSNVEMAEMLASLDGANDIEFEGNSKFTKQRLQLYLDNFSWTFKALNIFKNKNDPVAARALNANRGNLGIRLAKGSMCASLSRQFVDYILDKLDLTRMLKQLNGSNFGVDEHLFQSLAMTRELFPMNSDIPKFNDQSITRYAHWIWDDKKEAAHCRSGIWRHSICVFGLADLAVHLLDNPSLFANKMMPEVDMEAIYCWHREMKVRNGN